MKVPIRGYGSNQTAQQRQITRAQASDVVRTRGTNQRPQPPRDIILQSSSRGILASWSLPSGFNADIQGWRVYKGDENMLYKEIQDRGTRQCVIESTAGSTPPVTNVFVSSLNAFGIESAKIQAQGKSSTEAGAPPVPGPPPGYTGQGSGGGDKSKQYQ